jgi:chemotaxis methyl-accepting protein methylase
VDATDIDRQSLDRAAEARYRADAVAELPAALAERYLIRDGAECRVAPEIRRRVAISRLDLGSAPPLRASYDLILCRNVVIYFERPMQERVFNLFVDSLAPGGYLVLGKVETLFGPARDRLAIVNTRERIYRRPA